MRPLIVLLLGVLASTLATTAATAQCASLALNVELPSGAAGPRLWTPDGAPVIGSPFTLALQGAQPGAPGAIFVSTGAALLPLPIGTFYIDPSRLLLPAIPFVVPPGGDLPLGGLPVVTFANCGIELFVQAATQVSPAPLGYELSNGLWLRFGDTSGIAFGPEQDLAVGESPRGLDVADLDGDGTPDLLVANTSSNSVSAWLSLFGTHFVLPDVAVGSCPSDVRAVDLNGDGLLDLITSNSGSDDITTALGTGFGFFAPAVTGPTVAGPRGLVVDDFDGDAIPDAAVCDFSADMVTVLHGVGDGTFTTGQVFGVVDGPFHMQAADMDGDGRLDLVIAARSSGDVQVALGHGDGSFATPLAFAVGSSPRRVAVGDLNGDGIPDAVVANWSDNDVSVLLGVGDGTLVSAGPDLPTPARPAQLELADCDGDGRLDLVLGSNLFEVSIYPGIGNGTFGAAIGVPYGDSPNSILARDLDLDGIPDLIASIGPSGPGGCPAPTGMPGVIALRSNLLGE